MSVDGFLKRNQENVKLFQQRTLFNWKMFLLFSLSPVTSPVCSLNTSGFTLFMVPAFFNPISHLWFCRWSAVS